MPFYKDTDPCPECGTPLGDMPFNRKCRQHRLHRLEVEAEEQSKYEREWSEMSWLQKYEENPSKAFEDLVWEIEELKERL